jgi:hypothetical protein
MPDAGASRKRQISGRRIPTGLDGYAETLQRTAGTEVGDVRIASL